MHCSLRNMILEQRNFVANIQRGLSYSAAFITDIAIASQLQAHQDKSYH